MNDPIWHLNTAEGSQGPYTADTLRSWLTAGQITDDWYVWKEGLPSWQRIGDTPELTAPAAVAPPPPPPAAPSTPAAPAAKETKPAPAPVEKAKATAPVKVSKPSGGKGKSILRIVGIIIALIAISATAIFFFSPEMTQVILEQLGIVEPPPPPVIAPAVKPQVKKPEDRTPMLKELQAKLVERGDTYDSVESVLRAVLAMQIEEEYPDSKVVTAVDFMDKTGSLLGTLDVVLLSGDKVVFVQQIESGDSSLAGMSAQEVLDLFVESLLTKVTIKDRTPAAKPWALSRFTENTEYIVVGTKEITGFDLSLGITRAEAKIILGYLSAAGSDSSTDTKGN